MGIVCIYCSLHVLYQFLKTKNKNTAFENGVGGSLDYKCGSGLDC